MLYQRVLLKHEQWKILLILSACRLDIFKQCIKTIKIPGKLISTDTEVTHTAQWYQHQWSRSYKDTIIITSCPTVTVNKKNTKKRFFKLIFIDDAGLDPRAILNAAVEAYYAFPGKRILAHINTPHLPFIGKKGIEFQKKMGFSRVQFQNADDLASKFTEWALEKPSTRWNYLKKLYQESLCLTLKRMNKIFCKIDSNVCISSDHGELIGERGKYTHHEDDPFLCNVPWFNIRR